MPAATNKPQPYAQSPQPELKGSLQPYGESVGRNFNLIEASIRQIIAYLYTVEASIATALASLKSLLAEDVSNLNNTLRDVVYLTAESGGSTWNLADLDGYPNIRAVVIDPNGESNTLNLPALSGNEKACITIKCLSNSGNVTIDAGADSIVTAVTPTASYSIPYAIVADGATLTTYAATLAWKAPSWQVIDSAILIS